FPQGIFVAGDALASQRAALWALDQADATMAQCEQVFSHRAGCGAIVQANAGAGWRVEHFAGVDHRWQAVAVTTGFAERVEGAKLDHAICLVGVNQFGISGLDFFAPPGIAQQYAVVERLRGLLYAAD